MLPGAVASIASVAMGAFASCVSLKSIGPAPVSIIYPTGVPGPFESEANPLAIISGGPTAEPICPPTGSVRAQGTLPQYGIAAGTLPVLGSAPELNPNRLCRIVERRKTVNTQLKTQFVAILIPFVVPKQGANGATRGFLRVT
ncbi:MAG: hypothetical protein ABIS14_07955 [Sphingomonas sp.]